MRLAFAVFALFSFSGAIRGQGCAIGVTSIGVKVGSGQSQEVRTRNTLLLNQLFARINAGRGYCHRVDFPEGVVEVNGVINVFNGSGWPAPVPSPTGAYGAITIGGVNREQSIVMQTVPDQPVFRWNSNNLYVTSIYVHDLGLDNSNWTGPYNPQQWGMEFRCTQDGSGGNSWGFANSQFERLNISHMYVGFGLYTAKGGVCGVWSNHLTDMKFNNSQRNAIYLVGGSIGQPANVLTRIDVLQGNNPPNNVPSGGDQVDAAALMAIGTGGLLIDSLDIEGWNSSSAEIEIYGGNATVINNLRVEHAAFTGCNPTIGYFDGDVTLNGTSIGWDKFANSCLSYVFSLGGEVANLNVNGLTLASTTGAPLQPMTVWRVDDSKTRAKIFAQSLNLNKIATEWMPNTSEAAATTLYSRYEVEHLPPPVDKLPEPGIAFLGRTFQLMKNDTGAAYSCVRENGHYSWIAH